MRVYLITSHPADIESSFHNVVKLENGLFCIEPPRWTEPPTKGEIEIGLYARSGKSWGELQEYRRCDGGGRRWAINESEEA